MSISFLPEFIEVRCNAPGAAGDKPHAAPKRPPPPKLLAISPRDLAGVADYHVLFGDADHLGRGPDHAHRLDRHGPDPHRRIGRVEIEGAVEADRRPPELVVHS